MPASRFFLRRLAAAVAAAAIPAAEAANEFDLDIRTTAPLTPGEERLKLHPPDGFEIQLVASEPEINKPMNLAFDAVGRLWVTTSQEYPFPAKDRPGRDRLMIFEDFGADGRARKATQFADGLNIPIGVYPFRTTGPDGRDLWKAVVWSIPDIWLLEDTDGDGKADRRTVLYGPFDVSRDTHGNQASFRRGFDGWLYATHGYNNDSHVRGSDGIQADFNSGNAYRVRLDGGHIEHFTWGQVNPFGLAWDPWGNLYSSDCHSAPVYQLLAGGYYPSFGKPHDGLGFAPALMEHAHGSTAIDGMMYYNDDLWPAAFRDRTIIGNVMTSRLNQDRIELHGSSPKAIEEPDFLISDDPWFRPVDNLLGPDGALYTADFYNRIIGHYEVPLTHPGRDRVRGRIWRTVARDGSGGLKLRPPALALGQAGLIEELASASEARRMLAMNELADRFGKGAESALQGAFDKPVNHFQRVHALWLLARLASPGLAAALERAGGDADALVRVHALRVVRHLLLEPSQAPRESALEIAGLRLAVKGLDDVNPLARRCAAQALAARPAPGQVRPLLRALEQAAGDDTHLLFVLRQALRDHLADPAAVGVVAAEKWNERERLRLAEAAMGAPTAAAAAFLARQLPLLAAQTGASDRVADALRQIARYAPQESLDALAPFAQDWFKGRVDEQLTLFRALVGGLERRGMALTPEIRAWGARLAESALAGPDPAAGWQNQPLGAAPTANPWDFQDRRCADGEKASLISSHPRGEPLTGTLRSPVFNAPARLQFWLSGHDGYPDHAPLGLDGVCLRAAADGRVIVQAAPPRNDTAQRVDWDLATVVGQPVYFEAFDGDTEAAYAWLAFGRFAPALPWPSLGPRAAADRAVSVAAAARSLGLTGAVPALVTIAAAPRADGDARQAAATAALALSPDAAVETLGPLLMDASEPTAFRARLGEAIAGVNRASARAATLAAIAGAPYDLQRRWIIALMDTRDGADAALEAVSRGVAAARILQWTGARNHLRAANPPNWEARLAQLTAGLPPADAARDRLIAERAGAFKARDARVDVGRQVFVRNCSPCHQINGEGGLVGPQLTGVGVRGVERLCEDILDPNRNVDRAFRQTLLNLKDGEVVSGLMRREEGDLLVLADATAKEFTVKKADVAERRESDLSLMPDNFGEAMPPGEFNHLLAYLLSQRISQ